MGGAAPATCAWSPTTTPGSDVRLDGFLYLAGGRARLKIFRVWPEGFGSHIGSSSEEIRPRSRRRSRISGAAAMVLGVAAVASSSPSCALATPLGDAARALSRAPWAHKPPCAVCTEAGSSTQRRVRRAEHAVQGAYTALHRAEFRALQLIPKLPACRGRRSRWASLALPWPSSRRCGLTARPVTMPRGASLVIFVLKLSTVFERIELPFNGTSRGPQFERRTTRGCSARWARGRSTSPSRARTRSSSAASPSARARCGAAAGPPACSLESSSASRART